MHVQYPSPVAFGRWAIHGAPWIQKKLKFGVRPLLLICSKPWESQSSKPISCSRWICVPACLFSIIIEAQEFWTSSEYTHRWHRCDSQVHFVHIQLHFLHSKMWLWGAFSEIYCLSIHNLSISLTRGWNFQKLALASSDENGRFGSKKFQKECWVWVSNLDLFIIGCLPSS